MKLNPVVLFVCSLLSVGCMAQYEFPAPDQPHAILKLRRQYVEKSGTSLNELLVVDEQRAFSASEASRNVGPVRTDAVLLHPGTVELEMRASFVHQETRTRMVQESYSCGTGSSPRTCSRSVSRTETVTVTDAACSEERRIELKDGTTYLIDLDFHDGRNCRLRCMIQVPDGAGEFSNEPCPILPPASK